jgi:hypothetical protein
LRLFLAHFAGKSFSLRSLRSFSARSALKSFPRALYPASWFTIKP